MLFKIIKALIFMKKIRVFFAILSVVMGIGGAFAFTPKTFAPCTSVTTFYYNTGTGYAVANILTGQCLQEEGNCLYFDAGPNATPRYQPCDGPEGPWDTGTSK
jgi:hypothetical protein